MSERDDAFREFGVATREEIQRAHDVLHAICIGEVPAPMMPENLRLVHATHDALSWVLGFECGETFRKVLSGIAQILKDEGCTVCRNHPPA